MSVGCQAFALFETPLGRCSIAWTGAGLAGVGLPEVCDGDTCSRVLKRFRDAVESSPPPAVVAAAQAIAALLRGEARDLSGVVLDMTGLPPFHRRVYEAARAIPAGSTVTYGELAARCGAPGAARAVGQALGRNPFVLVVPCHRVVQAGGGMGGFSAHGGVTTKRRLLAIEGAATAGGRLPEAGAAQALRLFTPRGAGPGASKQRPTANVSAGGPAAGG